MRTRGSAEELERRRRLAVQRVSEGYTPTQVADFLGVHRKSVAKWWRAYQQHGDAGLAAKPVPGRTPRLTDAQEKQVLAWLRQCPMSLGFANELWTGKRVAQLIQRRFRVRFHPNYINAWLTQRRITPQKPQKRALDRKEQIIRRWRAHEWPRIQNERVA